MIKQYTLASAAKKTYVQLKYITCNYTLASLRSYLYIYIAKGLSNPRKESTPSDGDGKRK